MFIKLFKKLFYNIKYMNKKIIITDTINTLIIVGEQILKLELALNLSKFGKIWKYIGDHLYMFYTKNGITEPSNYLYVSPEQFDFLKKLHDKIK